MSINKKVFVHETAVIDNGAIIGEGTKIWHWVHVCSKSEIGKNCILGQNVYVGNNVKIGKGVKIQNNVSVYDNITLEDHVFCGPSCVFTNVINPRSEIERKNEYKNTIVGRGVSIGANATIVCGVSIGHYALIGAGAVVTKDVKPYSLMVGVPAKQVAWISEYGNKINLPLKGTGKWICEKSGKIYQLNGEKMSSSKNKT